MTIEPDYIHPHAAGTVRSVLAGAAVLSLFAILIFGSTWLPVYLSPRREVIQQLWAASPLTACQWCQPTARQTWECSGCDGTLDAICDRALEKCQGDYSACDKRRDELMKRVSE